MTLDEAISRSPLRTITEFPELVARANATERPFPTELTIPDLLDAAARAHGSAPALRTTAGVALSHQELAEATRVQAAQLASVGVRPGVPVAVLVDHEPAGVQAVVAIVRAGGWYVPLDPRWPVARCVEILVSLGVTRLVVGEGLWRHGWEIAANVPGLDVLLSTSGSARPEASQVDVAGVPELWDAVTASEDPCEAAGFNLDGSSHRYTFDEVRAYVEHVVGLVPEGNVVEIGAGSGLIARRLAEQGRRVVAVDPAVGAMARLAADAERSGLALTTHVGFAHDVRDYLGDAQVVVLASTVQYFPNIDYLADVLDAIADALPTGASIVLADLIDPLSGQFPGSLRIPRRWWSSAFVTARPGVGVHIRTRVGRSGLGPLAERYDVVLTVAGGPRRRPVLTDEPRPWDTLPRSAVAAPGPTDLAYTISTSGSTGVPKAVAVRHRSVINLVDWFNRRNDVTHRDVVLQIAALTFDLSVYDIFGVLAAGGSALLLPDAELAEPAQVAEALLTCGVTLWNSAPAAFTALLAFLGARPGGDRSSLRRVFLSGDWVPLSMWGELTREFPDAELVALGGATEACVWSNDFRVTRVDESWASVPYGHPMQNARYYVLDGDGLPCDVDEPGELFIAGECVAAGYLNDPKLTAERFLSDPWQSGSTMYRTGDRARWTRHGWLEFLGRLDHQVKIRGYRIELGDVERAARAMAAVADAVAVTYGSPKDPNLGLVVRGTADEQALREHLRARLPEYMMPLVVVPVPVMPISPTGKVDRAALSALCAAAARPAVRRVRVLGSGRGV